MGCSVPHTGREGRWSDIRGTTREAWDGFAKWVDKMSFLSSFLVEESSIAGGTRQAIKGRDVGEGNMGSVGGIPEK